YMKRLSARPHHLGSPYDKDNAEWLLATFKSWGLDAKLETFDVLFPSPKERVVELVEPTKFTASLREPAVPVDPTSGQHNEQLPTYNAYSIDGDVTAPLVYVNYGIPDDYEQLERMGISVKGCIVITRYGASWRGIKPKVAAEHGAVGCIIYSDPREDGYFHGDVFPQGPWRPKDGVQRGSVMDMPLYPGDPLTPGIGATEKAKRLAMEEVQTFTKIPVLPISYADAQPLLAALTGPVAPESWRGALPLTYKIGPGPAKVRLRVQSNWDIKKIYNVIVTIRGSDYPDEWIIRGNHHDGWVNGAQDPISGMVAQMEEMRGLSELMKQGWRPKRTLVYCAWDAEEQGLLGSTEWAEAHAEELKQKTVTYINTDGTGRGYLFVSGSHTLEKLVNNVAKEIEDPEKKISVWKRSQLWRIGNARTAEDRQEVRSRPDLRIGALGSGSDYTAFLDHLGIASLHFGYGGEDGGGIYHSIYDGYYWYTNFSDTDFSYGRALSQTCGTAVIRLADADILPYDFANFTDTIRRYADELKKLLKNTQDETKERNTQIEEGVFTATADPKKTFVPPSAEAVPPYLNFAPLDNAVDALNKSSERYTAAMKKAQGSSLAQATVRSVNAKLIQSERKLTGADGLPGRPWFKHLIYAPGFYTGYGVKTIPGVREGIEQKKWSEAEAEIVRVARALQEFAVLVDSAAAELEKIK
ncbi:MAG: transferrin receptor-like dimerization domain-containing protein, partial [Bacteroidota bacterium]